jgi:N-acetylneuraminic acid mutarotase
VSQGTKIIKSFITFYKISQSQLRFANMKPTVLILLFTAALRSQVWTGLPDFPGSARDDGASALVNNHAFFGTGLKQDFSATRDWYDLDLATLTWTSIPSMPPGAERQYACAFAGANSFYLFGGDGSGGALNDLYQFDLQTKQWIQRSSRPGKGVIACACAVIAGKAMVYGGKVNHDSIPTPEVWEYNMSNDSWTRKENAPFGGRWRSAMASLGPYVYVAGGAALPGGDIRHDLWSYDPGSGTWDSLPPIPVAVPVNYASMQALGNKLVYFGGQDGANNFYNKTWYYRVVQGDWQAGPALAAGGRKGGMSVGWNEKFIYTCGLGEENVRLNDAWILDLPLAVTEETRTDAKVYPNPFDDIFRIEFTAPGKYTYLLFGADGRTYSEAQECENYVDVRLPALAPGIYYLKTTDAAGKAMIRKLIRK